MTESLRRQLLNTSRGRIVARLQTGGLTAEDLAAEFDLTASAVRLQLAAMERDGVVRRAGKRAGSTRPFQVYELTPEIEQLLSKAYLPLLTRLVDALGATLSKRQLNLLLRRVGRQLARDLDAVPPSAAPLRARVAKASAALNEHLGAVTHVEENGSFVIRGSVCPLAALTGKHPGVCLAVESLVSEIAGAPAVECCDRAERPRCVFEIPKR
jgi:predicted ArsR family transcriptional regulator